MISRICTFLVALVICLPVMPKTVLAQGQGGGKAKAKHKVESDNSDRDNDRQRAVFTARDRDIIRQYFRGRYSNLPPGLAKRGGDLPPGLKKHLERNGTLPPGLQKRLTPFPDDLDRRLPPLPAIYRRGSIGQDVVIVDTRTQRVLDIIHAILRP